MIQFSGEFATRCDDRQCRCVRASQFIDVCGMRTISLSYLRTHIRACVCVCVCVYILVCTTDTLQCSHGLHIYNSARSEECLYTCSRSLSRRRHLTASPEFHQLCVRVYQLLSYFGVLLRAHRTQSDRPIRVYVEPAFSETDIVVVVVEEEEALGLTTTIPDVRIRISI